MKKLSLMVLLLTLGSLAACSSPSSSDDPFSSLKIVSPAGAPALGLFKHVTQSNVEVLGSADNIASYFSPASDKDVIFAPTNLVASKIMTAGAPYKLAANITFGNFYLCATGNDDNNTLDNDDYVVLFQQNGLPHKLFSFIYGNEFSHLAFVDAGGDAASIAKTGKDGNNNDVDYVLVPQPALTGVLSYNPNASQYSSLQDDFKTKTGGKEITQASVFIRNSTPKSLADAFLTALENDINELKANANLIVSYTEGWNQAQIAAKYSAQSAQLLKAIISNNSIGIGFKKAIDNKASVDTFLMSLGFLSNETSEEVYYI